MRKKIFEETKAPSFLNLTRHRTLQIRADKLTPHRISIKKLLRYIRVRVLRAKNKGVSKAAREKQHITYQGLGVPFTIDFLLETMETGRKWKNIFRVLKDKTVNQEFYTQCKYPLRTQMN